MFSSRCVQIYSLIRRLCHWPWRRCFTSTHLCYSTFWINIFTKTPNFTFPRSWLIFNLCSYFVVFLFLFDIACPIDYARAQILFTEIFNSFILSAVFFCVMVIQLISPQFRSVSRNERHGTRGPSLRSFLRCCITQRGRWSRCSTVWTASWIAQGGCIPGIRTLHPANSSLL